jgi:precorrin-2 dehydrogenase / sirohydrochlorin ferrochelatase
MRHYYAMMVDLSGCACLIIGGGAVAERKASSLLQAGAKVVIVSPTVTPLLEGWAEQGRVEWRPRSYRTEDGKNCALVIAATNHLKINRLIYQDAKARGQWINVVDQPELCNFAVPATIPRGKLQISVSTGGASPMLAKKIRRELEGKYGKEYELYLDLMQEVRYRLQQEVKDLRLRYHLFKELTSDRWIDHCRTHPEQVREWIWQWIDQHMAVRA